MKITLTDLYKLSLFPQLYLYFRFFRRSMVFMAGFTLIELLVVIAILGVLAGAVLVAINPGARIQEARDAKRKTDISQISQKLELYTIDGNGSYPGETWCDSSIGVNGTGCPVSPAQNNWNSSSQIVVALGGLPTDPTNNTTYHYRYEPNGPGQGSCTNTVCEYWIGARLERPSNPSNSYFRCSNDPTLTAGIGCREVSAWGR